MRSALLALLVFSLAPVSSAKADGRAVVLVTDEQCPVPELSALDVRKIYMSITVSYQGVPIRGFRLNSDELLDSIFYQYVVAMTRKSYERRLLSMILKHGTPEPRQFDTVEKVAQAIGESTCSIGYMWRSQAERFDRLRTIKLIWQGK